MAYNNEGFKAFMQASTTPFHAVVNASAILEEAGYTLADVVKATVLLADMADFAAMNTVYAQFFTANCPARAAFAVKELPRGAKVEIEVIACRD